MDTKTVETVERVREVGSAASTLLKQGVNERQVVISPHAGRREPESGEWKSTGSARLPSSESLHDERQVDLKFEISDLRVADPQPLWGFLVGGSAAHGPPSREDGVCHSGHPSGVKEKDDGWEAAFL